MAGVTISRRVVLGAAPVIALAGCAQVTATAPRRPGTTAFPPLPPDLRGLRRRILTTARAEHAEPRPGTSYSQGVVEPWCADFVSWVMREAGAPFVNPHSGGWRIPGVQTLWAYQRDQGRFRPAEGDYRPRPGDMVLYDATSVRGEHVNLVIRRTGTDLLVVGGNEGDAIVVSEGSTGQRGIIGYGLPGRHRG